MAEEVREEIGIGRVRPAELRRVDELLDLRAYLGIAQRGKRRRTLLRLAQAPPHGPAAKNPEDRGDPLSHTCQGRTPQD
jgi:hypothetical protein